MIESASMVNFYEKYFKEESVHTELLSLVAENSSFNYENVKEVFEKTVLGIDYNKTTKPAILLLKCNLLPKELVCEVYIRLVNFSFKAHHQKLLTCWQYKSMLHVKESEIYMKSELYNKEYKFDELASDHKKLLKGSAAFEVRQREIDIDLENFRLRENAKKNS